jgi:hypothetical protein
MKVRRDQKLLHAMRTLRGRYIERVNAGETEMDREVLAAFDKELGLLHEAVLGKHARSEDPIPSIEV